VLAALQAAELPADLIEAWDDLSLDIEVRGSHDRGMDLVGLDVGTPGHLGGGHGVLRSGGHPPAPYPVRTPVGSGTGLLLVASTPGFYELKRTRDERPRFDIGPRRWAPERLTD